MLENVAWTDDCSWWTTPCDGKPPVCMAKSCNDPKVNGSAFGKGKGLGGKNGGVTEEVGDTGPLSKENEG